MNKNPSFQFYPSDWRKDRSVQEKVEDLARENGYPMPIKPILNTVVADLIVRHRRSLICEVIDDVIDSLCDIHARTDEAVKKGDLMGVLVEKDALARERDILKMLEKLLDMEAGTLKKDEDMERAIERAREYPFEDLLPEPLRMGRCRCPIHDGKNQSEFAVKNNRGKCWSCGWQGDPIQYVMDTQGITFSEAVRRLS